MSLDIDWEQCDGCGCHGAGLRYSGGEWLCAECARDADEDDDMGFDEDDA